MMFMVLVPLLIIGLVVWLIWKGGIASTTGPPPHLASWPSQLDARALLDETLCPRGKIDRLDYLERREGLTP